MKKLLPFFFLALNGVAAAEWKLNPYTQRQDYYEGTAAVIASTGALQSQINTLVTTTTINNADIAALKISTGAINSDLQSYKTTVQSSTASIYVALQSTASALTSEIARATARENAIAVSTGAIEAAKVNRAGDTMSGDLTRSNSSDGAITQKITFLKKSASNAPFSNWDIQTSNLSANTLDFNATLGAGTVLSLSESGAVYAPNGLFVGNLSGNVTGNVTGSASLNMLKTGDTMTGQLTINGSSLTVNGPFTASRYEVSGATSMYISPGGSGISLVSLGDYAGLLGSDGTYLGHAAGAGVVSGGQGNTMVGSSAGSATTTGRHNVYVGNNAALSSVVGTRNTVLGYSAGQQMVGSSNTYVGAYAGSNNTSGDLNIVIGYNKQTPAATDSNKLNIGDAILGDLSAQSITLPGSSFSVGGSTFACVAGKCGVGENNPTALVHIKSPLYTDVSLLKLDAPDDGSGAKHRIDWLSSITDARVAGSIYYYYNGVSNLGFGSLYSAGYKTDEILTIRGNKRVGINTTAPGSTLHVNGDATTGSLTASSVTATGAASFGGNVGIGTASPSTILEVREADRGNGAYAYGNVNVFTTDASAAGKGGSIGLGGSTGQATSPFLFARIRGPEETTNSYNGYLAFDTNSGGALAERVRVTSAGNVGIGTASPGEKLSVSGGIGTYSRSMAELLAITPSQVGVIYFCNDCSPTKIVVSTGTAAGNFADAVGGTFK